MLVVGHGYRHTGAGYPARHIPEQYIVERVYCNDACLHPTFGPCTRNANAIITTSNLPPQSTAILSFLPGNTPHSVGTFVYSSPTFP